MANRVVLGVRNGSQTGLYVSKSAQNALTATNDNLLFSSDLLAWQAVQTATISLAETPSFASISYPNLGYIPTIIMLPKYTGYEESSQFFPPEEHAWISNATNTTARLNFSPIGPYSGQMTYCVLRIPFNG